MRDRQELHDHHPRDGGGRSGQVEQQRVHGDGVEPVAELRDRLADEQQPEVPVVRRRESDAVVRSTSPDRVSIIVAFHVRERSGTTRSSTGSAPAGWARCTARATRGSAAPSRSRCSRAERRRRSGDRRERFLRDARAAAALSHPNIAALYEIGEEQGQLFLVFEFVPGETLTQRHRRPPAEPAARVDLAAQIADALADAHAAGIVHGDIKPDNIIVTPKGNAKILDFGSCSGKRSAAPAGEADHRIDIEALGVVLFEMLTGRPPSEASPRLGASMPRELDEIVGKALGAYSEGGYEAAATCAAELRSIAAMLDVRAASADPVARAAAKRPARAPLAGMDHPGSDRGAGRAGGLVALSLVVQAFRPAGADLQVRTTSVARSRESPAASP